MDGESTLPPGLRPAGSPPARSVAAAALPADPVPARTLPAGQLPAGQIPAGQLPAGQLPAGVWRAVGDAGATSLPATVPTGWRELDQRLPGGGWPLATLVELLLPVHGIGELELLMPALRRLTTGEGPARWVSWFAPPYLPYAPALVSAGLEPRRMLVVRPRGPDDVPWAMEHALRSGTCAAALGWVDAVPALALKRLKLAAEAGDTLAVLFRPLKCRDEPSPAALRLALTPRDAALDVEIVKSRGAPPARLHRLLVR